ncbi:3-oxoadipate enol-lactonase [Niveibacterium umoris]|uniref:3-oxoadipate enol-lactonase n=1 Tax=Niveibacterium umoris TaxID=1193620 RepID=A0A840BMA2_9RHOO|nr:3-oxoadipate enol-lactonase [Niveibacterium umoris]
MTLLHALGADQSIWDAQAEALAQRFTVLRPDLRGHGRSGVTPGAYSLPQLAADIVAIWDALRVERSHVVGISLGGFIAQHLALDWPARVDRLVLADTSSGYPPEAAAMWPERIAKVEAEGTSPLVPATLERWFTGDYRMRHRERVMRIGRVIETTSAAGYAGCCQAIAGLATTERLGEIAAPTLVLVGEHDVGTPVSMSRVLADGIPGAELRVIENAAHLSNVEQPAVFSRLLFDFLD